MAYNIIENFGAINQGRSGEIRVQLVESGNGEPLYDIAVWNGNWRNKAPIYPGISSEGIKALRDLLRERFGKTDAPKETPKELPKETPKFEFKKLTEHERVVHALSSLPVNDGNYPKVATKEQLEEAITIMNGKAGNKTRIAKCKAMLAKLTKGEKPVETLKPTAEIKVFPTIETTEEDDEELPFSDVTVVKTEAKAEVSDYGYEDAKAKLLKELEEKFKGDSDSEYVINGVIEACLVDSDLCKKVMDPQKSFTASFAYLFKKAKEGNCIMIGNNAGIMDKDTALGFVLEYFKMDEPKAEVKATEKTKAPVETKTAAKATRKATKTRKTWGKRGRK